MKDLFCGSILDVLQDNIMKALQAANLDEVTQIRTLFDILRGMFDDVDTEWKRIKYFSEKNVFVHPEQSQVTDQR